MMKLFLFSLAAISALLPAVHGFTEQRITNNANIQIEPAIDGNRIVWQDNRNKTLDFVNPKNHWDIYLYDITTGTEQRKTDWTSHQINPAIDGNWIVWEDDSLTSKEIYALDLTPGQIFANISNAPGNQIKPDVSDGMVVWQDDRNMFSSGIDIYLYDLAEKTTTPICQAGGNQIAPKISGRHVVWLDGRDAVEQIYYFDLDLGEDRQLTTANSVKGAPAICGDKIVWHDYRNGDADIYLYDLATDTETRITTDPAHQWYPAVSEVGIVWVDYRYDPDGDLFFYDFNLKREVPLVIEEHQQLLPDISGNRIVWMDYRNDLGDIYMLEYSPPAGADLAVTKTAWPQNARIGDRIVYTVTVVNYGPLEATGISITDDLSSKVQFVSAVSTKGTCSEFNGDVVCGVGAMASGESVTVTLVVTALKAGSILNAATVEANEDDPISINNSATATTQVLPYDKKRLGDGWFPNIQTDNSGFLHVGYTRKGQGWTERFGDPEFAAPISHLPDDIVYATNRSGRWTEEIVFDGIGYGDPFNVGNPRSYRREAVVSALALDAAGHAHIAYQVNKEQRTVFGETYDQTRQLWYTNKTSGAWSRPELIAEVHTYSKGFRQYDLAEGYPLGMSAMDLDIDRAGHAHAMYMRSPGFASLGHVVYLTNSGGDWTSTTVGLAYDYASLAVDSAGLAHIGHYGWGLTQGGEYYSGMLYITNAPDGVWREVEEVDPDWTGAQLEGMVCEITMDSLDRPQISFVDGAGEPRQDYWHAVKTGGVWQIERVAIGSFISGHNQIDTGPDHAAHILYPDPVTKDLMYANNVGGDWAIQRIAPQDPLFWYMNLFDLSVDSAGGVHILYHDKPSGDLMVYSQQGTDVDGDGIGDSFEQGPDGSNPNYDGNGDGTPDSQQDNATSFTSFGDQGYITIACPNDVILSHVEPQSNPSPDDAPDNLDFLYDFIGFSILGLPIGGSTTVTIYLPPDAAPTTYYKYGPTSDNPSAHWYEFMYDGRTGAVMNGNVITLHFIDGQRGDNDLTANGILIDPGAAAAPMSECVVDLEDLVRLTDEWMLNWPSEWMTADLDGDGKVGISDFAILAEQWMKPCPAGWPWR